MIGSGFDALEREELDEMGALLNALNTYVDWTGMIARRVSFERR